MRRETPETLLAERRWPELSEVEEKLYRLIVPKNQAQAVNPEGFANVHGQKTIDHDLAFLARREKEFEMDSSGQPGGKILAPARSAP